MESLMSTHIEVRKLVAAINGALESLEENNPRKAGLLLYQVLGTFDDSRLASNQEVWQLYDSFLSVAAVCAARVPDEGGTELFAEAVRRKLKRIRP